jgi:hypothetical protein
LHHLIHFLFALNETYYSGDKRNVEAADVLPLRPRDFAARAGTLLVGTDLAEQKEGLKGLVLEAESLGRPKIS